MIVHAQGERWATDMPSNGFNKADINGAIRIVGFDFKGMVKLDGLYWGRFVCIYEPAPFLSFKHAGE